MSTAEKLTKLRKEYRLTQQQLAERLDVSRQAVSRWEVGESIPTTENLNRLSLLYGIPLEYLLNDKSEILNSEVRNQSASLPMAGSKLRFFVACSIVILIVIAAIGGMAYIKAQSQNEITPIQSLQQDSLEGDASGVVELIPLETEEGK